MMRGCIDECSVMVGVRLKRKPTPKWVYTSLFAEGKSAIPQYVQLLLATAKTRRRCETNCGNKNGILV